MDDVVTYELADQVAWLTINRPEARNALSAAVREGLWEGLRRFADDADAVARGTGGPGRGQAASQNAVPVAGRRE